MKRALLDLLLFLCCVAIVLLVFLPLLGARSSEQEDTPAITESVSEPGADVVLMASLEPTATPEPEPTPYPSDIPYNPAIPLPGPLQYVLWQACEDTGVEYAIALAVIEVESDFDPYEDNGLCYGYMQLNRRYFPDNLSPGQNIRYGMEYLGECFIKCESTGAALETYHAGYDTGSRVYANAVLAASERWRDVI